MGRVLRAPWHERYLKFTRGQESPELFHTWTAFSVLASALGRNVYIDRGYYKVFPNFYVILIAESAICRRTHAVRIGEDILKATDNAPSVLSQKITPQAMIRRLMSIGLMVDDDGEPKNSECVIISEELAVFLGENAFQDDTAALLTTFFDCKEDWDYETKGEGKEHLHHICVNMLGTSTPDWLRRCIPHDAVGGGFVGRFLFIEAKKPGKLIPRPHLSPEMLELKNKLIADLSHIRQLKGEFKETSEATKFFDSWYRNWMSKRADEIPGYGPKKHTYVHKLAMVLCASRKDELIIELKDVQDAIVYLDKIEMNMKAVTESIWVSPIGAGCERVLQLLKRAGKEGIQRRYLQSRTWRFADAETLNKILDTLIQAGLAREEKVQVRGKKERRMYYPCVPED